MPGKGKGGGGGGGGGGGKGSKGSVKVGLGYKSQEKVLAVVQQQKSKGPTGSAIDFDSKKVEKRLAGLYEKLSEAGFTDSQVERGLTACCLSSGEAGPSLEEVLDWLCLNLSMDELPAKFADPSSREMRAGRLDVGHVGSGISSDRRQGSSSREGIEYATPAIAPRSMPKRGGEDDVGVDKSWILAHVEKEAQAEQEARQVAKAQESARRRWDALSPEEKLELLEASYEEEKEKARVAKESGRLGRRDKADMEARLKDIREQISELKVVVGKRKKEMKRLKESLLADAQPALAGQAQTQPAVVAAAEPEDEEADLGGMFDDDDDEEEEQQPPVVAAKSQPAPKAVEEVKKASFEDSVIEGMFGDDSSDEDEEPAAASRRPPSPTKPPAPEPAPASSLPAPSPPSPDLAVPGVKEALAVPDLPLPPAAEEPAAPPPPPNQALVGMPANWSGKTPRRQLEEYLQKRRMGRASFVKGVGNSCTLTLKITGEAQERRFESVGEFLGWNDAQQAAATRALFDLEPRLQLSRVLPPPFREWWNRWTDEARARKEEESAMAKKGKKDRIQSLVQSIKSEAKPTPTPAGGAAGRGAEANGSTTTPQLLPDNTEMGWEDQAGDGEEERAAVAAAEEEEARRRKGVEEGERMRRRFESIKASERYRELKRTRDGLPVAASRREILDCIERERVVVVCGETGCGKSTQIAQYIVEDAVERGQGHLVNVVCTQPRRVAAMALADRVAAEMGEEGAGTPGSLVGYQIRMESRAGPSTRLLFCTTGILLRRLQSDPTLSKFSHLVLDEIHERQSLGDFLLIVVRDLLAARPDLKVVLMSATVNAELFCGYFGNAPCFSVPGRTFPVEAWHLEDVLDMTGHVIEEGSPFARRDSATQFKRTAIEVSGRGGRSYTQQLEWEDEAAADGAESRGPEWASYLEHLREEGYKASAVKSVNRADESVVNYDLIEDLLLHIVAIEPEKLAAGEQGYRRHGAVLVFLPGLGEIRTLLERLKGSRSFGLEREYLILALHSSLSSREQQRAFQRPPPGVRKIILSTNIAETSVTIDDVSYVIDSGLLREIQLANKGRGGNRALVTTLCCRASAKQRMGRAGRVGPGLCFRLYSSFTHDRVMSEFSIPEIKRVPLEELCLAIRANGYSTSCHAFLSKAIEPPADVAVASAIKVLVDVGALTGGGPDAEGELTPLGIHLARLPMDVRLGKMLVFAALLRCLDPVLTIAAALGGSKSPLLTPIGKEQESRAAHSRFEVRQSDFLTLVNVFEQFRKASRAAGQSAAAETRYCNQYFLGRTTLKEMQDLKVQYFSLLVDIGLVERPASYSETHDWLEGFMEGPARKGKAVNSQAGNVNLVLAAVCAGLYPNVARAGPPGPNGKATFVVAGANGAANAVNVHRSSVNSSLKSFTSPWLIYHEKFTTTRVYVAPTSVVSPYALLLFGGPLTVDHLNNRVVIDDWIDFHCPARTAVLFKKMRVCLVEVLQDLIRHPLSGKGESSASVAGGAEGEEVLDTLVGLLADEEPKAAWIEEQK